MGEAPSLFAKPPTFPNVTQGATITEVSIKADALKPGNYRLYCYVRDGKGAAATANLPFQIQ